MRAGPPSVHYSSACSGPGRAPWRVLWASKIVQAGPFSRDRVPRRRATQDHRNPTILAFRSADAVSHRPSRSQGLYLVVATVKQQSHTKLFHLCDGHRRCFCVCVCAMFPVVLGNRDERIITTAGQLFGLIGYCASGRLFKPTLARNFNSNHAATVRTSTHLNDCRGTSTIRSCGTKTPALEYLVFVTATVLLCSCVQCSPGHDAIVTTLSRRMV